MYYLESTRSHPRVRFCNVRLVILYLNACGFEAGSTLRTSVKPLIVSLLRQTTVSAATVNILPFAGNRGFRFNRYA